MKTEVFKYSNKTKNIAIVLKKKGTPRIIEIYIEEGWRSLWRGQLAEKAKPDAGSQGVREGGEVSTKYWQVSDNTGAF